MNSLFCHRLTVATLLMVVVVLSGCGPKTNRIDPNSKMELQTETAKPTIEKRGPGTWTEVFPGGGPNGTDVLFTIQVPKTIEAGKAMPLIFALHFGGRVTPHYGKGMLDALVSPGLGELNAIVVAPDSQKGGWNSEDNQMAVAALFEAVNEAYSIDKERTLVTGFSKGGHGAYYYALNHPEMFKAGLPIAGNPAKKDSDAELKVPVYIIHSQLDKVVKIGPAKEFAEAQKAKGANVTFVELDDLTHYQTAAYSASLQEAVPWVKKVWGDK